MHLWGPFVVRKDCNSLSTESAKVEAISSLAVCSVCMFACALPRVEGQGKDRQTPSHLSIRTQQREREREGGDVAGSQRGRDVLIKLEKWGE